ncbi:MAG TPA: transporter [Stellaceae bacterium]|nr:transporter [Stellaceae bacterium]
MVRRAIRLLLTAAIACAPSLARADEGGVSFWIPGYISSLAAVPSQPGFSLATIYLHESVSAGSNVAFARQITSGGLTLKFNNSLDIDLKGHANLLFLIPSYAVPEPVLGGQLGLALAMPYGRSFASVSGTLTASAGGPGFTISGGKSQDIVGFGDFAPLVQLKWNAGVDNYMTYVTGNIPVGRYDADRIVNLGLGHESLDAGGAYTYFNPQTGWEFSGTLGFTYNFENGHTNYQGGVDSHLDLAISKFVTPQLQLGVVGYLYQQLSCDSGSGDLVGCFRARTVGLGPQLGYGFPLGDHLQGYLNLKGYGEFAAQNRVSGWNTWLTFAISPAPPPPPPPRP